MSPTLVPGDVVFVRAPLDLELGDVVVARHPSGPSGLWIKRVAQLDARTVFLEGDNPSWSTDSRHHGPLPLSDVLGRVTSVLRL